MKTRFAAIALTLAALSMTSAITAGDFLARAIALPLPAPVWGPTGIA
jgi:putative effector of murein hydrolase LrgA (UPF0299 family)